MQFERSIGGVRVMNAGSVGMPFGGAGAYWLLLGPNAQPQRTEYDLAAAAEAIRKTTYPQAVDFADNNMLTTPSEAEALAQFGNAKLIDEP